MEEKKKYEVVGTVTIGSDEYRDLIEDVQKVINDRDRYMRQGWEKDSKITDLTKEVEKLTAENKKLKDFIKKPHSNTKDDFVAMFFSAE